MCVCKHSLYNMQCACAMLSHVDCPALQYFSTLSHKGHDFRGGGKVIEQKMCVLIFSTISVSNIFYPKNKWTKYGYKFLLVPMWKTRYFFQTLMKLEIDIFWKNSQISNLMEIRSVGAQVLHTDGQTDMKKLTVEFLNVAKARDESQNFINALLGLRGHRCPTLPKRRHIMTILRALFSGATNLEAEKCKQSVPNNLLSN